MPGKSGEALARLTALLSNWAGLRKSSAECQVPAHGIVEAVDISGNSLLGCGSGMDVCAPDQLGFQHLEERLHHGFIVAVALAVRRRPMAKPPLVRAKRTASSSNSFVKCFGIEFTVYARKTLRFYAASPAHSLGQLGARSLPGYSVTRRSSM